MANYSSTIIDKHNGKQEFDWTHKMTWPGAENLDKNQGLGHGPINHPCSQRPSAWFTRYPHCCRGFADNASNRGLSARTNNNDDNSTTNHRMPVSMPTGPGPSNPCSTAAILSICRYPLLLPTSFHAVVGTLDSGSGQLFRYALLLLPPAILVFFGYLDSSYWDICKCSTPPSHRLRCDRRRIRRGVLPISG